MRPTTLLALLLLLCAVAARPAQAQDTCNVNSGPAIATCSDVGATPEIAAMNKVACILQAINDWRMRTIACVQRNIAKWQTTVMYPTSTLKAMGAAMQRIRTLREEAEHIVDWPQDFKEDAMNYVRLYSRPDQLRRNQYERMWGPSAGAGDDIQDFTAWLGTLNQNSIQSRTINTFGLAGELPQETWSRIGFEGAVDLGKPLVTPLDAMRNHATMAADQLRVRAYTIRLDAQELATTQALADQRRLRRLQRDAAGDLIAATAAAGVRPRP